LNDKIIFDYFTDQEADILTFYRIPKLLFTNDFFKELCVESKVLYGLMLDRMSLSIKNKWFDSENRAYIYFSQQDAMEMLNCKENKAGNMFKELEAIGLIERKRQGQGKPAIIYLKNFVQAEKTQTWEKSMSDETMTVSDMGKTNVKTFKKPMSRDGKNQSPDMGKTNANYNNTNNNNINISNQLLSDDKDMNEEYAVYARKIRENVELEALKESYPHDTDIIDGMYDLILEIVLCRGKSVWISKNEYPAELVKSKFLKLNYGHLEYVMECLKNNTTKIRNIKSYILSTLFNAPATMGSYYRAEVNYDLYGRYEEIRKAN